jgi:4-hydroxy-tetrahydrodipicolinate reductase
VNEASFSPDTRKATLVAHFVKTQSRTSKNQPGVCTTVAETSASIRLRLKQRKTNMKKYRVIQWGAGYIGYYALKYILNNPKLELVGLKCHTEEKEGKTAGELCGMGKIGVKATRDAKALIAMEADCVIYMPRDTFTDPSIEGSSAAVWFDEMLAILESGKNVVTSLTAGTHHRHLANGEAFRAKLNAACKKGNSTVFFSGFDPGFSDILAITMAGAVGGIKRIDTWEMVDYGDYPIVETLQNMGYGSRPEDLPAGAMNVVRITWGGVPYLMAQSLGVEVEEIKLDADLYLAPETFTSVGGLVIEKGTVAALRFSVTGIVGGKPMFVVNHVTRIGQNMAPDWPRIGRDGGYVVEIDAYPPFRGEYPMGLPGGTGTSLSDAMCMTSARCVNAVESVVLAKTGYVTFLDLMPVTGRYAVAAG